VPWDASSPKDGRKFRVLTVVDQWSRQSAILEARSSFTGKDVVAALERVRETAGLPDSITVDHGTELMSKAVSSFRSPTPSGS
jgi:putative transposase